MSLIVKAGKAGKQVLKSAHLLPEEVPHISYARRIERVRTPERICAMTFDDGPMNLPAAPDQFHGRALTDLILDALAEFDAKGTFDVIGDTGMNYPDKAGREGSAAWGGIRFDHYPDIHKDEFGGAVHNDRIIRRMLAEGHQITNHGYRHILFGKKPFVYARRVHYGSVHSAVGDLRRLDIWMKERYQYDITMGRPPHYVDGLSGGFTSYDVYDRMGYQYLAASFDGAGWLPVGKLEAEIAAMTDPMRAALEQNPDFFCGQIIFQKDGYNMARRTPVAWGLPLQLEILHQYGYQVVTVAELMEECPFVDVGRDNPLFEKMARLAKRRGVAYSDNRLRLENHMTMGELAMLLAPKEEAMDLRWARMRRDKRRVHPYYGAVAWCKRERILPRDTEPDAPVTELPSGIFDETKTFTRRAVYEAFREDWINQGEFQEAEIQRIEEQLHGWTPPPLPKAPEKPEEVAETPEESPEATEGVTETPEATEEAPEEVTETPEGITETPEEVTEETPEATEEIPETAEEVTEAPEEVAETPEEVAEATEEITETAEEVTEAPEAVAEIVEPEPVPEEVPQPEVAVEPEPVPEIAVEPVPEVVPQPEPAVEAEPVPQSEPVPEVVPEPVAVTIPEPEPVPETPEEVYVHALAEVYTEDSETVHKIRNLPHVDDIPHVDGIPQVEPTPESLDDLFPPEST
ncbi:MAG: polysaccharide deacetylase family protein [Oscillibacter sp.]|nr:polysaccharide deacetylase family protein [Oscillibacter sp.]